jgi:hypothetical protein
MSLPNPQVYCAIFSSCVSPLDMGQWERPRTISHRLTMKSQVFVCKPSKTDNTDHFNQNPGEIAHRMKSFQLEN